MYFQLAPPPEFIEFRQKMWDRLKKEYDDWVNEQVPQPIKVTLPDGKAVDGLSWRTTPYEVAKSIR
jgi:threonyl-tRNA synthetase